MAVDRVRVFVILPRGHVCSPPDGLADDRVHSPNEKFELRCFRNGMRAHTSLLAELARLGPAGAVAQASPRGG